MQVKIVSVEAKNNLKLLLSYSTGERKEFDVAPYATGGWFGELKDPGYFSKVCLLPDGSGIEWPDDQDIAPPTSCMSLELMFEFRRRYRLLSGLDTPSNRLNLLFNRLCLSNGFLW